MQIEHSQLWTQTLESDSRITVTMGQLWLTFDGEDIVLGIGEAWIVPYRGEVMAQPLGAAHFMVDALVPEAPTNMRWGLPTWNMRRMSSWRVPHLRLHF